MTNPNCSAINITTNSGHYPLINHYPYGGLVMIKDKNLLYVIRHSVYAQHVWDYLQDIIKLNISPVEMLVEYLTRHNDNCDGFEILPETLNKDVLVFTIPTVDFTYDKNNIIDAASFTNKLLDLLENELSQLSTGDKFFNYKAVNKLSKTYPNGNDTIGIIDFQTYKLFVNHQMTTTSRSIKSVKTAKKNLLVELKSAMYDSVLKKTGNVKKTEEIINEMFFKSFIMFNGHKFNLAKVVR
jgi:hypothetical protein